jgi:hypothetical protein
MSKDEIEKKIRGQVGYCKISLVPVFIPKDGICSSCDKQIFDKITIEEALTTHITGCPFCHYSYCE